VELKKIFPSIKSTLFQKYETMWQGIGAAAIRLFIFGALGFLFSGCLSIYKTPVLTPTPTSALSILDWGLLSDQPCRAPCWYGLELEKSTKADVIATLQNLPWIDQGTIKESPSGYWDPDTQKNLPATLISAECRASERHCVGLELFDDRLIAIRFNLKSNILVLIEDLVEYFDPPEFVRTGIGRDGTCSINLTWWNQQIMAVSDVPNGRKLCATIENGGRLDKNLAIDGILYELPESLRYEVQEGNPWPGFTEP
jgi:hypothetical protein